MYLHIFSQKKIFHLVNHRRESGAENFFLCGERREDLIKGKCRANLTVSRSSHNGHLEMAESVQTQTTILTNLLFLSGCSDHRESVASSLLGLVQRSQTGHLRKVFSLFKWLLLSHTTWIVQVSSAIFGE